MGKLLLKVPSLAAALANINACFLSASAELAQPDGASLSFGSAPKIEIIFVWSFLLLLIFFCMLFLNIKSQSQAWFRH